MIKNIEISNFKIIESLKLSSLKRVNVIAGKNGKGKTSILDSIFITNDIASPDCLIKPIAFRGGSPDLMSYGYLISGILIEKTKYLLRWKLKMA